MKKQFLFGCAAAVAALTFLTGCPDPVSSSPGGNTYTVNGTVTADDAAAVIADVTVALTQKGLDVATTKPGADGTFQFSNVAEGTGYVVRASLENFDTAESSSFSLPPAEGGKNIALQLKRIIKLQTASIAQDSPDKLDLVFDVPVTMNTNGVGFTVKTDFSTTISVSAAAGETDKKKWKLTLDRVVDGDEVITLSYGTNGTVEASPGGWKLKPFSGDAAKAVTNDAPKAPPEIVSAKITKTGDVSYLNVVFNKPLDWDHITTPEAGFTFAGTTPLSLTAGAGNGTGNTLIVSLSRVVAPTETGITLSYDKDTGNLKAAGDRKVESKTNLAVENATPLRVPELTAAVIEDSVKNTIKLTFNMEVSITNNPFTVTVKDSAGTVKDITVTQIGASTNLTIAPVILSGDVAQGDIVTLSCQPYGVSENGTWPANYMAEVTDYPVTNNVTGGGATENAELQSAVISDNARNKIVLTFSKPVTFSGTPAVTVQKNGTTVSVTADPVSAASTTTATLVMAEAAAYDDSFTVSVSADYYMDAASNAAVTVTNHAVTNNVAAPNATLVSAEISNEAPKWIALTFSKPVTYGMAGMPNFTVKKNDVTISWTNINPQYSGGAISFSIELSDEVFYGDIVTISTTNSNIKDVDSDVAVTFTNFVVTNNVADVPARLIKAEITDSVKNWIELTFSKPVKFGPGISGMTGFTVTNADNAAMEWLTLNGGSSPQYTTTDGLTSFSIELNEEAAYGDTITISTTNNNIKDVGTGDTVTFTNFSVTVSIVPPPPTFVSAEIGAPDQNASTIIVKFTSPVSGTPVFTVKFNNNEQTISWAGAWGTEDVLVGLSNDAQSTDVVTLTYVSGLLDSSNSSVAAFGPVEVTNSVQP